MVHHLQQWPALLELSACLSLSKCMHRLVGWHPPLLYRSWWSINDNRPALIHLHHQCHGLELLASSGSNFNFSVTVQARPSDFDQWRQSCLGAMKYAWVGYMAGWAEDSPSPCNHENQCNQAYYGDRDNRRLQTNWNKLKKHLCSIWSDC
jgi:hypothetical protein